MNRPASILYGFALYFSMFVNRHHAGEPCGDAKVASAALATLARDQVFIQARNALSKAATDGKEHSIVFGKDAAGRIIISPIKSIGLHHTSAVESTFPGAFADIHNHPASTVPSTGDIYNLITIHGKDPLRTARITVLANGTIYAAAIINSELASAFIKNYPVEQAKGFSPRLPERLFNEFAELKSFLIHVQRVEKTTADEMATAFILDKYQSGVALLRQLDDQVFARVYITQENSPTGTTSYQLNICK